MLERKMAVIALTNDALSSVNISRPTYDRTAASVGIVHFGFGNFHRSHQAMYLDRLMERGEGLDWGICEVGVLEQDRAMRDVMRAQDGLFTLVLRHPDGSLEPRVVGSVLEYLWGPEDADAVYARLVDPAVRIVSLTVTEGGYLKNPATGAFDASHPSVVHDLGHLEDPRTAFAYIVEGLRRRRDAGIEPFTVLSCDNLQGNGIYARQAVVGFANLVDPELAEWIDDRVAFPNCMVDRITPATTDADREAVATEFGIEDRWPVPGEPFTQWIVEDEFPTGRPALEDVDVQFVDDVKPYELMKLRLLNASHQALAYFGAPLGYVLVDETMRDDRIRRYLERYMAVEAAPTLGDLPGDVYEWTTATGAQEVFFQSWGREADEITERGLELRAMGDRAVIKVVASEAGIQAAANLTREGVPVLLTAVYATHQAVTAAAIGVTYIAPYLGKMAEAGGTAREDVAAMHELFVATESPTRVLAASLRSTADVFYLAQRGVDAFALPVVVADKLMEDALTAAAVAEFDAVTDAW